MVTEFPAPSDSLVISAFGYVP